MNIKEFKKMPIMGILRDLEEDCLEPLVEVFQSVGLKTIEMTMNTPKAVRLIKKLVKLSNNRLTIGAGTVLNMEDLYAALNAGATFIVSPVLVYEVVDYCARNEIKVFPGAFTPQEIYTAWSVGATMVKVFPAKFFGPSYFKEIKGPFKEIDLLACGGVTSENIQSFFASGASAVAFGGSVFSKESLKKKQFPQIKESILKLITSI